MAEPHHFSDYGFDPQIDCFQVLEEAKIRRREASRSERRVEEDQEEQEAMVEQRPVLLQEEIVPQRQPLPRGWNRGSPPWTCQPLSGPITPYRTTSRPPSGPIAGTLTPTRKGEIKKALDDIWVFDMIFLIINVSITFDEDQPDHSVTIRPVLEGRKIDEPRGREERRARQLNKEIDTEALQIDNRVGNQRPDQWSGKPMDPEQRTRPELGNSTRSSAQKLCKSTTGSVTRSWNQLPDQWSGKSMEPEQRTRQGLGNQTQSSNSTISKKKVQFIPDIPNGGASRLQRLRLRSSN
ncbi:hypothetical protein U1Q18_013128 [Sarracenia purpurea var. burkii]